MQPLDPWDDTRQEPEPPFVAELRRRQSLSLALVAGLLSGALYAFIWGGMTGITGLHVELVWLPMLGLGLLVGRVMALAGRGIDLRFGIVGALCTLAASAGGYLFAVVITVGFQVELANNVEFVQLLDAQTLVRLVRASLSWGDMICFVIAAFEGFRFSRLPVTAASLQGLDVRWSWKLVAVMVLVCPAVVLLTWLSVSRWAVSALAVPPGDRLAVCRTTRDGSGAAELWDLAKSELICGVGSSETLRIAVAQDTRLLATAQREREDLGPGKGVRSRGLINLWNTDAGVHLRGLQPRSDLFGSLAFSADDQELLVANRSTDLEIWSLPQDAVAATLLDESTIFRLAVSPVDSLAATASADGEIQLWDYRQRRQLRTLPAEIRGVSDLAFSPDGAYLAVTAALSPEVTVWDVAQGQLLTRLPTGQVWLSAARFSPDGALLAVSGGSFHSPGEIELWKTAGWQKDKVFSVLTTTVRCVAFTRDSAQLIAGSSQSCRLSDLTQIGRVHRWDLATGDELPGIE